MAYKVNFINRGRHFVSEEEELSAKCTCVYLKGKKHVIVNTMSPWDEGILKDGCCRYGIEPDEIDYVVCTSGSISFSGGNHYFPKSIQIVGHSIQKDDTFLPEPFSEGKPYKIDGDDLVVVPTAGRTLDAVSVLVKTRSGLVAIVGDLFISYKDIDNEASWLATRSECPLFQRHNREVIINMADVIIPGYGVEFSITDDIRRSFEQQRKPHTLDAEIMAKVNVR